MAAEKIDALELDISAKLTTENLDKLITALGKLSKALDQVNAKRVKTEIEDTGKKADEASQKTDKLSNSFLNQAVKITALVAVYRKLANVISDGIEKSMSYTENLNLFTVSLGEYADNAKRYGDTVKEALGIDPSNWIRTQGVFNTLIQGFGVAGDQAAYMSQNLTQLTYDIASFYNLSITDAEKKIQSAVAGELEPVRRLGYDLSQNALTAIAQNPAYYGKTTYSINQETGALEANSEALSDNTARTVANFNELTQAEKVQLRYIALMTQVTQAQGDMARTLNDPANQMRIFKEQINQTSRALGNVFIPVLNQAMPYITAFFQLLERALNDLATFFGFEIPDMSDRMDVGANVSAYDDIADAMGRAARNAKKMKDYMLGIDELNVFRPNDDNGGGGGSALGNYALGSIFQTPGYDFLGKAIENRIEQARNDLELLSKDFKEHPVKVGFEIIKTGSEELGSKIWTWILGMTPEELQAQASALGVSVEHAFLFQLGRRGWELWAKLIGKSPNEAIADAKRLGEQLKNNFVMPFATFVSPTALFVHLFGDMGTLKDRAAEAGRTIGEQLSLEISKKILELFNNPVMKWAYESVSGRSLEDDIAAIDKKLTRVGNRYKATGTKQEYGVVKDISSNSISATGIFQNTTISTEAEMAGKIVSGSFAKGLESEKNAINRSANSLYSSSLSGIKNNGNGASGYKNVASELASAFYDNLASAVAKNNSYNSGEIISSKGVSGAKSQYSGYKNAGINAGQGYIAGIESNKKNAEIAGSLVAMMTLAKLKTVLGIHSPSTEFAEAGYYSVLGYSNAVEQYAYYATNAVELMSKKVLGTVDTSLSGTLADPMSGSRISMPNSGVGMGIGISNGGSMANLASQIYTAVVSGMSVVAETMKGGTKVIIDGKEVFTVVQNEERKNGVAIGNGAFSR